MSYRTLVVFLLVSVFGTGLWAQPENAQVETVNGKKYYVHIVEQGNTLYGIQTLYKSNMEDILGANPGLTDNLSIGQRVLIPVPLSDEKHYGTHVVAQGETLYGISKKYGCTVNDLLALNPGAENGLSIGQSLKVPTREQALNTEKIQTDPVVNNTEVKYEINYADSLVQHTVLEHETLYSISKRYMVTTDTIQKLNNLTGVKVKKGDVLLIPVKKVNYEVIEKQIDPVKPHDEVVKINSSIVRKEVYSVALLLPFMFSQNDVEMSKPLKIDQVRELYPTTKMCFEFYQGFLLAADTLQYAGLNVNIYVYDTKKDSAIIQNIFAKPEFEAMDLVVGPMYQSEIDLTVRLCREAGIPVVLPFKADASVMNNNPGVYKTVASNMTLFDGAVDYILANHSKHNVLIVKPNSSSDVAIYERSRERYNEGIKQVPGAMNDHIVEVTSMGSNSGRDLESYIRKDTVNVVLVPSENIKFVAGVMTRLNSVLNASYRSSNLKIIIFGIEDWNRYDDLDVLQKNKLNQHFASYRYVDYNQGKGKDFVKFFRSHYGTDPTLFSTQGYDIGLYFMGAMHLYGKSFDPYLSDYQVDLIQNDFRFSSVTENSGKENNRVCVVQYHNFELVLMSGSATQ